MDVHPSGYALKAHCIRIRHSLQDVPSHRSCQKMRHLSSKLYQNHGHIHAHTHRRTHTDVHVHLKLTMDVHPSGYALKAHSIKTRYSLQDVPSHRSCQEMRHLSSKLYKNHGHIHAHTHTHTHRRTHTDVHLHAHLKLTMDVHQSGHALKGAAHSNH